MSHEFRDNIINDTKVIPICHLEICTGVTKYTIATQEVTMIGKMGKMVRSISLWNLYNRKTGVSVSNAYSTYHIYANCVCVYIGNTWSERIKNVSAPDSAGPWRSFITITDPGHSRQGGILVGILLDHCILPEKLDAQVLLWNKPNGSRLYKGMHRWGSWKIRECFSEPGSAAFVGKRMWKRNYEMEVESRWQGSWYKWVNEFKVEWTF